MKILEVDIHEKKLWHSSNRLLVRLRKVKLLRHQTSWALRQDLQKEYFACDHLGDWIHFRQIGIDSKRPIAEGE